MMRKEKIITYTWLTSLLLIISIGMFLIYQRPGADVLSAHKELIQMADNIRNYYKNPVIMLTSYDGEEDIIEGLNAGADDYVPKPFSIGVLRSRIASQMRRRNWDEEQRNKVYFSGDLKINFENKKFYRNGEPVQLRAMEIEICEVLIRNYGRLVTRELLLENLWDAKNNFIEDNTLSVHISRIRRKLQKYEGKDYIETVKGIGYRWNIEVNKN